MRSSSIQAIMLAVSLPFAGACGDSSAGSGAAGGSAGDDGSGGAAGSAGAGGGGGLGGVGGLAGSGGDGSGGAAGAVWGDPIIAAFSICCAITQPVNLGEVDVSVDATAQPTSDLVAGQTASLTIEGVVDLTGAIPVQLDASVVAPSTFTLEGGTGTSSSITADIPVPQTFNTGDNPLLIDIGSHEVSIDIDAGATEVCLDLTATQVTVAALGSEIPIPCAPGTCAGVPNNLACADVSP